METITIETEVNHNKFIQTTPTIFQLKPHLKRVIYIFSYLIFIILLFAYILSQIYKTVIKTFLLHANYKILPPSDACWANQSQNSPSNIVIQLQISKDNPAFFQDFKKKLENVLKTHKTSDQHTFQKLSWTISEKFGFYVYNTSAELNVHDHIYHVQNANVKKLSETQLGNKLPGDKPQWRIYFVENQDKNYLLLCFHHCYGDGISWVNFLNTLADHPVLYYVDPFKGISKTKWNFKTLLLTPHHFSNQLKNILFEFNQFHGSLAENEKSIKEFQMDLTEIKGVCYRDDISITEFIEQRLKLGFLRVFQKIPMDLITISPYARVPYENFCPVNQFYPCLGVIDFTRDGNYNAIKTSQTHSQTLKECNLLISEMCGGLMSPVQRLIAYFGARGTVAFSNLPAFKEGIWICGAFVEEFYFTPPVKWRTGISLGVVGYAGRVYGWLSVDGYVLRNAFNMEQWVGGFLNKQ